MVHVSGHACEEELKLMLSLVKPKYFIPVHGEYRHLYKHAALAEKMGIKKKNIFIPEIGSVIELNRKMGVQKRDGCVRERPDRRSWRGRCRKRRFARQETAVVRRIVYRCCNNVCRDRRTSIGPGYCFTRVRIYEGIGRPSRSRKRPCD